MMLPIVQNTSLSPWGSILIGAIASWVALKFLVPILYHQLPDHPNERSAHCAPTPRGGGISFVMIGSTLAPFAGKGSVAWIPLSCLPLAILGMLDDRVNLPASFRFSGQLLTAVILLSIAKPVVPFWLYPFLLLAVTAVINFVNFMDGLDGLVATNLLVVLVLTVILSSLAYPYSGNFTSLYPLIGALIGFLPWNWSPAKVFMGDVGSTFLGAVFAGVVLQQSTLLNSFYLLLIAFPLLGDAGLCVLRRYAAGHPVFSAHRLHLFQRLFQAGWSHQNVTILYAAATLLLGLGYALIGPSALFMLVGCEFLVGLLLDRYVASPFTA